MNESWHPTASIEFLKKRAASLHAIRSFFLDKGYLEVETPIMGHYGVTDVYLNNIEARCFAKSHYLQTSPEYHMKRLLAAGSGPIFQISRAFRDDEQGRWHNPEFSLLEWYRLEVDHHGLMDEVSQLLQYILNCPAMRRFSFKEIFQNYCKINPFKASVEELQDILNQFDLGNILKPNEEDIDQYLFLLLSHVIEPQLRELDYPVAIYDFPVSQASLAKINNGVAERFEVYYKGIELANGFHELTDYQEQLMRFENDNKKRQVMGLPPKSIDVNFLDALKAGLPNCSGIALGIDRLIALQYGQSSIDKVLSFSYLNA